MNVLNNAVQFIISSLFDFAILLVLVRMILQAVGAPHNNQVVKFLATITNPVVAPLQRVFPKVAGIDSAALLVAVILVVLKSMILFALFFGATPPVSWLIVHSLGELLNALLNIYLFSIIILALLSWVNPMTYNPATDVMNNIAAPMLRPLQRVVPLIGGVDLSPMLAVFIILLLKIVLVGPLLS